MDWSTPCAYDSERKRRFHAAARARLRRLALLLRLPTGSFDLRSNLGGIAVSGEITLHHEVIYLQVSQPALGSRSGILIRTCRGRRDFTGGPNHFAPRQPVYATLRTEGPRWGADRLRGRGGRGRE